MLADDIMKGRFYTVKPKDEIEDIYNRIETPDKWIPEGFDNEYWYKEYLQSLVGRPLECYAINTKDDDLNKHYIEAKKYEYIIMIHYIDREITKETDPEFFI